MIVIFGGTGTLGHALANIIAKEGRECWIVSRCELRQKEMAKKFPNFHYVIGDVTKTCWADYLPNTVDHVFNLAALKHVDIGEFNVQTCVDINYFGTVNTFKWACNRSKTYSLSSTDKAVLSINAYGMSKALAEKFLQERANYTKTTISVFAWGNILASRGSVFKEIDNAIKLGVPVKLTDKRMSRFFMLIEDAAKFMWENRFNPSGNDRHIPCFKATTMLKLIDVIADGRPYQIEEIGIRPGEKLAECLRSGHDYCIRSDMPEYQYTEDELRELIKNVYRSL